jgi:hypothetical protein
VAARDGVEDGVGVGRCGPSSASATVDGRECGRDGVRRERRAGGRGWGRGRGPGGGDTTGGISARCDRGEGGDGVARAG